MPTEKSRNKDKFENIAKELGCDESENALDKAIESLNLENEKKEPKKED